MSLRISRRNTRWVTDRRHVLELNARDAMPLERENDAGEQPVSFLEKLTPDERGSVLS